MKKTILLVVVFLFCLLVIPKLKKIQSKNNYNRCKSVVSFAINTGRLPRNTDVHDKCKYHLE